MSSLCKLCELGAVLPCEENCVIENLIYRYNPFFLSESSMVLGNLSGKIKLLNLAKCMVMSSPKYLFVIELFVLVNLYEYFL